MYTTWEARQPIGLEGNPRRDLVWNQNALSLNIPRTRDTVKCPHTDDLWHGREAHPMQENTM
jgi:hypothetical protein